MNVVIVALIDANRESMSIGCGEIVENMADTQMPG